MLHPSPGEGTLRASTYIELLDGLVVLSEPSQPVRELLHEPAAAADADGAAPQAAARTQQEQDEQEPLWEHAGGEAEQSRLGFPGE